MSNDSQQLNLLSPKYEDFPLLEKYILPYEDGCVQLANYIRKKSNHLIVLSSSADINNLVKYLGILYIDHTILHCIPNPSIFTYQDKTLILNLLKNKEITCISGLKEGSDFLYQILSAIKLPQQMNIYNLMILKTAPKAPEESLSNSDKIIRCTKNNLNDLFPLQLNYLQKEVAPLGKQISPLECKSTLRQMLENQIVLALHTEDFDDMEFVAKVNSNAIGINWIQIGGVYTHPLFRKNHYAWFLLYTLCQKIFLNNKKTALFVKEKNIAAISLYKKIGFIEKSKFTILYY